MMMILIYLNPMTSYHFREKRIAADLVRRVKSGAESFVVDYTVEGANEIMLTEMGYFCSVRKLVGGFSCTEIKKI